MASTSVPAPKRRTQYTLRACNGCRRRRCKCDGAQPTCGTCAFYGHECSWDADSNANRPATKQLIESLRVKIQVLETEIRELRTKYETETLANQEPPGPQRGENDYSHGDMPVPVEFRETIHLAVQQSSIRQPIASTRAISSIRTITLTPHDTYQFIFNISTSTPPNEQPKNIQQSLSCEWNRHLPPLDGVQLSRIEHDTILDRCLRHYSALLHCSLLALATAFSDDPYIKWRGTREKFAQRAKQLLEEEFHRPSLTLAQSLAILSEYHCGFGENEKGYMYMGMSIRTVCALNFYGTGEQQDNSNNPLCQTTIILRDWNFWSIFCQDKIMSLEYNRDFDLTSTRTNAQPPYIDLHLDHNMWHNTLPPGSVEGANRNSRITEVFELSCRLMQIAADIITLADSKTRSGLEPQIEECIEIRKLEAWRSNLTPALLLSDSPSTTPLPHVIVLNICYWWLSLRIHRPFCSTLRADRRSFEVLSIEQSGHAAHQIMQLINMYNHCHSLHFFPQNMLQVIFAAGTALLQQWALLPADAHETRVSAQIGIQESIQSLRIISKTWGRAESLAAQLEALAQSQGALVS